MEIIAPKPLRQIWLKASVVGSIWASIEIIFGSFLHNLKIPLSGMLLSFISVWLIISFLQVWRENGLVWRAGIICALMKSISPSAIILGPMTGILTEALIIELFIFILGKNIIGYLFAGAFAVLSTILHKIVSLLIIYSFDFLKILSDLYQFAVKQIGLNDLSPNLLIVVVAAIYIVAGMVGAIGGYLSGLRYSGTKLSADNKSEVILHFKNQLNNQTTGQSYSLLFLLINILTVAVILFLINYNLTIPAIISGLVYIGFCFLKYRNSLRRLKKFSLWISFIIITFTAAFLWNGFSNGVFFSYDGLMVGLRMNARAIIIIIGFTAISVELRNPLIKSVLYHRGFASLYQSLNLAFSALPFIISNISKHGSNSTSGISGKSLWGIFNQADTLFQIFEKEHLLRPDIVILTGEVHQGKTTFAEKIISALRENNISIAGFLSKEINDKGERTGYNLYDIESAEETELCSIIKDENRIRIGQFYFNNDTIIKGLKILDNANTSDKQLVVIDEIGHLELNDQGWSSAIESICRNTSLTQLWIVRRSIVEKITRKWNIGNVYLYDVGNDSYNDVTSKLIQLISAHSTNRIQ